MLDGLSLDRPVVRFSDGYVRDGTWVSGIAGEQAFLPIFIGPAGNGCAPEASWEIDVPIDSSRVVARLDGSAGTLAGLIPIAGVTPAATPAMKAAGFCPENETYEQLLTTFTQAADLVDGAPGFNDPSRQCDAISLGIGFTMTPAGAPAGVAPPRTPPPDECDAGVDAGGDAAAVDADAGG